MSCAQKLVISVATHANKMKYAIITGGNQGIGLVCAKTLAKNGFHVVIACRDANKASAAVDEVKAFATTTSVEALPLDLNSFKSVHNFAQLYKDKKYPLHVLLNNAGKEFNLCNVKVSWHYPLSKQKTDMNNNSKLITCPTFCSHICCWMCSLPALPHELSMLVRVLILDGKIPLIMIHK